MKRFWLMALMCAISARGAIGQSTAGQAAAKQNAPVYLPPFRPLEHGMAPQMRVQVLSDGPGAKRYAVIFGKGDEVLAGLTEFAEANHLSAAQFTAIGAISSATLGWLDPAKKMYRKVGVDQQVEVVSMMGDIAEYKGKPVIHAHLAVGYPDGTVRGGHLLEAHVWPTLEVMVTESPNAMHKQADPESGMALITPESKK